MQQQAGDGESELVQCRKQVDQLQRQLKQMEVTLLEESIPQVQHDAVRQQLEAAEHELMAAEAELQGARAQAAARDEQVRALEEQVGALEAESVQLSGQRALLASASSQSVVGEAVVRLEALLSQREASAAEEMERGEWLLGELGALPALLAAREAEVERQVRTEEQAEGLVREGELQQQVQALQQQAEALQAALQAEKAAASSGPSSLQQQQQQQAAAEEEGQPSREALSRQLEALQGELETAKQRLRAAVKKGRGFEEQLKQIQEMMQQQQQQACPPPVAARAAADVDSASDQLREVEQRLASKASEAEELRSKLKAAVKKGKRLEEQLQALGGAASSPAHLVAGLHASGFSTPGRQVQAEPSATPTHSVAVGWLEHSPPPATPGGPEEGAGKLQEQAAKVAALEACVEELRGAHERCTQLESELKVRSLNAFLTHRGPDRG